MSHRIVNLRPTTKADLWTKNRLHGHGPEFKIIQTAKPVTGWKGLLCFQVQATSDGWEGWFPVTFVDEFTPDPTAT